jgi:hypothetical protein
MGGKMKKAFGWIGWVLVLGLVAVQYLPQRNSAQKVDRWAYKATIVSTTDISADELNKLGQDGWELGGIQSINPSNGHALVILKRRN